MIKDKITALRMGFQARLHHAEYMERYSAMDTPLFKQAAAEAKNKCYVELETFNDIVSELRRLENLVDKMAELTALLQKHNQTSSEPEVDDYVNIGLMKLLDEGSKQYIKEREKERIEKENAENNAMEQALNFDKAEWKYRMRYMDEDTEGDWTPISKADFDYRCQTYGVTLPTEILPTQISVGVLADGIELEKYKVTK